MEDFKNPKLLITDHYDSIVQQVDIYTEELLAKYTENDLLPKEEVHNFDKHKKTSPYNIDGYKDPYESKYEYDMSKLCRVDVTPGITRIRDYLELIRSKSIEELKMAEKETLDNYELNKHLYKYNRVTLTSERVEEMKRNLFKDKFCFVIGSKRRLFTIITDFYLNEEDLAYISVLNPLLRQPNNKSQLVKKHYILDEKTLFLHLLESYIDGLIFTPKYGTELISITKSSLFEINRVNIDYMRLVRVYLSPKSSIDFSFIKSLYLRCDRKIEKNEIRDLSGMKNLEYLRFSDMALNANSFNGLNKLFKLKLNSCYLSKSTNSDRISFDRLTNLQILSITSLHFPIELKHLEKLKLLKLKKMINVDFLVNVSENINILELSYLDINMENADEFFSRLILPNLFHLSISYNVNRLPYLKEDWFSGMKSIKEFRFYNNDLESLDFCGFNCFEQLEKLDIAYNEIKMLKEGVFSKLKRLKWLNLSDNPILKMDSNAFKGLLNLEYLSLNEINNLNKDFFNGLTNLKELCLG